MKRTKADIGKNMSIVQVPSLRELPRNCGGFTPVTRERAYSGAGKYLIWGLQRGLIVGRRFACIVRPLNSAIHMPKDVWRGTTDDGAITSLRTIKDANRLYKEIISEILDAAARNSTEAQNMLGYMFYTGTGVEQNQKEAVSWYRKATEQHDAVGQASLGYMFATGAGVGKDEKEAVKWYRKAAEQNLAMAQRSLGWMYATGHGVEKDEIEAVKWLLCAADRGYPDAQHDLGIMYLRGRGVKQDNKEAVKWFRKAAEQNFALSQYTWECFAVREPAWNKMIRRR